MFNSRKNISAYVQGGFGNQLFIYFAALSQATRLNVGLTLDVSWYENRHSSTRSETQRILGLMDFLGDDSPGIYWQEKPMGFFEKVVSVLGRKVFVEKPGDWRVINDDVHPGARLTGYFQSEMYFQNIREKVLNLWSSFSLSPVEAEFLRQHRNEDFIAVHVRRGDYLLSSNREFHGLANLGYFMKSVELMRNLYGGITVKIFTDSPEFVAEEFRSLPDFSIVDQSGISEPAVIKAMAASHALVMSNSSFSWWAGYLMSCTSTGTVVAPRPWFTNGITPDDLLLPQWLTIGNEIT